MSKLSKFFGREVSRQAGKRAASALWSQKNGAGAYHLFGMIFSGCGVAWILLSFIPMACKASLRVCIWMWILAVIQIVPGTILMILSKKSKRFQKWADKDYEKGLEEKKKLEEKVTIGKGKVILPMTHGDVLAFKILGVIFAILILVMVIGTLQGWVVW
ncbi:MAG: hypothetical protein ACLTKI_04770 [Lachnospiraceae bacterium]